ncbi:MAG: hypothetical protein LBT92_00255 [Rickettsiales bacterium]|jgi:hypothetical protein|nr:hypothetical protein [Rickettsiales bacterium]
MGLEITVNGKKYELSGEICWINISGVGLAKIHNIERPLLKELEEVLRPPNIFSILDDNWNMEMACFQEDEIGIAEIDGRGLPITSAELSFECPSQSPQWHKIPQLEIAKQMWGRKT